MTTVDQEKGFAGLLRQAADILDPVVPGAGGTVVTPGGFDWVDKDIDTGYWNVPVFQEDFNKLSDNFLRDYLLWTSYAQSGKAYTTNADPTKGGSGDYYTTDNITVEDVTLGSVLERCLVATLKTKLGTTDKKNHGVQFQPKFSFLGLPTSNLLNYCISVRLAVQANAPKGWHLNAPLWWVDSVKWPSGGEDDNTECSSPYNIGGFFHNQGATTGGDQMPLATGPSLQGAFHVVRSEYVSGTSLKRYIDGVMRDNITTRVSNLPRRPSFQLEPDQGVTPAGDMKVYIAGVDIRTHTSI